MDIFNSKTRNFFDNEMCIDRLIYEKRIAAYPKEYYSYFGELGQFLIETKIDNPLQFIDDAKEIQTKHKIVLDEAFETAHVLMHAVKLFREKRGGLLSLFLFTESDSWEPLPEIRINLYSEMIKEDQVLYDAFPNEITVYRGTSMEEYASRKFGQSWTLSVGVANYFAFGLKQEKCNSHNRIVMKAQIQKEILFAYSNQNQETLCIVDPNKIIYDEVEIIKTLTISNLR